MLVHQELKTELDGDFDSIHNYYEHLVLDMLIQKHIKGFIAAEMIADIACVALNHLPPRYIRYDVDMAFYLSPKEYQEIEDKVDKAVNEAMEFVINRAANPGASH